MMKNAVNRRTLFALVLCSMIAGPIVAYAAEAAKPATEKKGSPVAAKKKKKKTATEANAAGTTTTPKTA